MAETAFGIGVYTAPEAARMVGMSPQTLRRWLLGYDHGRRDDERRHEKPLWQPQYAPDDDEGVLLGFRDLVEARIVNALRGKRIGLPTIRICLDRARDIVGQDHPFSTSQFKTDGKTIFLEIIRGLDEPQLIDLKQSQGVFNRVVAPSLADLDFGPGGAERWWLLHGKKTIVADPKRAFGQPIIAETGITTARVAQAVEAEGSVAKVAQLYEIKPRLIRDALAYESQLGLKKGCVKLLVDNNLPPVLGRGLGALFHGQHRVEHIRDKFGTGSLPDEAWIEALGKEGGWCVLSGDRRIATKRPSRELFLRSNLIGFFPLPAVMALPLNGIAARVLTLWPVLETTERTMDRGCFELGIKGTRLRPIG